MKQIAVCHPNRFLQVRGLCKNCYDKWLKKKNLVYRRAQLINTLSWAKKNLNRFKKIQDRRKKRLARDPLLRRNSLLRKKYGLDHIDYINILEGQGGGCALCFRRPTIKYFHMDHSHKTGKVRGVLCHQCNWYLGVIEKDYKILDRIRDYLKES